MREDRYDKVKGPDKTNTAADGNLCPQMGTNDLTKGHGNGIDEIDLA